MTVTAAAPARAVPPTPTRSDRLLVAAALAGAATVHASVVAEHLQEWPAAGWFFVGLAAVQGLLALVALRRLDRTVVLAVVATSLPTVATWLLSRTLGLPFGPPEARSPEAVGAPDLACCLLELAAAALAAGGLRRVPGRTARRLAAVTVAVVLLGSTAAGLQPGHAADEHEHAHAH